MWIDLLIGITGAFALATVVVVLVQQSSFAVNLREYIRELKKDVEGNRALAVLAGTGGDASEFVVESKPYVNQCPACRGDKTIAPDCDARCPRPARRHIHVKCCACKFEWVREP